MAIGYGKGDNRVEEAVSSILDNPLLEDVSIKGARRALIYVAGSDDLPLVEFDDVVKRITADMDKDAIIIPGLYLDSRLEDTIRVTVIATGFIVDKVPAKEETSRLQKNDFMPGSEYNSIVGPGLNIDILPPRGKRDDYRYESEDLDVPTVIRDRRFFSVTSDVMQKAQLG